MNPKNTGRSHPPITAQARTRTHDGGLPVKEVVAHGACGAVGRGVPSCITKKKEGRKEEREGKKEKKSGEWTRRERVVRVTGMYSCLARCGPAWVCGWWYFQTHHTLASAFHPSPLPSPFLFPLPLPPQRTQILQFLVDPLERHVAWLVAGCVLPVCACVRGGWGVGGVGVGGWVCVEPR